MNNSTRSPQKKKTPELLAPAGSREAFYAAVAAGADAVYLSGKRFGARKFSQNFSDEEIEEAIAYAHARGVRVYVTVNILIHDRELPDVLEYLIRLYEAGVDAVLVQDPGLAALAREIVPGLVLHASTQLTIHNAEGVRWAHAMGFSRVVLARELPLSEVEAISRATADTGVGLEVFAHGALCYSYSGQCLLSSVIGGRSGNRGMCAQPCRKKYALVAAGTDRYGRPTNPRDTPVPGPYLLSPKDLCTYRDIPRLADAPVASLKIEGRMKSPEYVAIVVSTYRRALDAAAAGTFVPDEAAIRDLLLAFNRGFTRGYLFGERKGKLMGRDRPDNRGLYIGTVSRYDRRKGKAILCQDQLVTLHPGDGLLFSPPGNPDAAWGCALNTGPGVKTEGIELVVPHPVEKGARVYLTSSIDLAARARQILNQGNPGLRHPVPAGIVAKVTPEGLLTLTGTLFPPGKEPVAVEETGDLRLAPARTSPLTADQLAAQLEKTGGTPFVIVRLSTDYNGTLFAPVSEINRVRREFFARAESALIAASRPPGEEVEAARGRLYRWSAHHQVQPLPKSPKSWGMGIILWADSIESVEAGARAGAGTICFEAPFFPQDSGRDGMDAEKLVDAIHSALEICRTHNARLIWKLPRITRLAETAALRSVLPRLHAAGLRACMVDNPGTAAAVVDTAPGIALAGSPGLNVFNAETVRALARLPFELFVLSPELSAGDISALTGAARSEGTGPALAVFAQGNLEAMITEDCLLSRSDRCRNSTGSCTEAKWYGIRDETGHLLPVRTDGACRGHIFNAAETCLVDGVPDLVRSGVDAIVIDARDRTIAYTEEMVRIYRDAIALAAKSPGSTTREYTTLRERAKTIALGGITAGHYTRGVKEG
jgi:putative protease